jgi:hypothetical protein
MRYDIPPPGFIARNYSQRPKSAFSPDARQLLFNFTTASTTCELGKAQDGLSSAHERPRGKTLVEVLTGFDPATGASACCQAKLS